MAERELAIVIRAKDLASKAIQGVEKRLGRIGSQVSRGLGNAMRNIERGIAAAGAGAAAGLGYALKVAGDFEAQMNTLNTIARLTGDAFTGELGEIGDQLRKTSRDTGIALDELTTGYYDLLSAGIQAKDAQGVLNASVQLGIGGLASTAETIDLLTTAINSYGGDATKAAQYADEFAVAIERGKLTAADLAASYAQVGPLAAAMGIENREIAASLGLMTSKGTPAAEAMTQMRAAMVALQRQTPEMKKVLKDLGIENAEQYAATNGLANLYEKLRKRSEELGIPMIELTGRVEGMNYALQNTGDNFAGYLQNLEAVESGTGTAAEQMEQRQKGLNFQIARMKALVNDAFLTLGEKLIPKVVPLLEKATDWIDKNQAKIEKFADDVAAGFEKAVSWAMSLDWNGISQSLQAAAGFGKGLVEAFLSMPSWVKEAVITGWGLNKLTGGMLTGILGEVAKGLIKGVLGINAGVVNVRGAVVNSPGGGIGGVGGVGGTGGRGLLGNVLRFLPAIFAAEVADQIRPMIPQAAEATRDALGMEKPLIQLPWDLNELQWPLGPKNAPDWARFDGGAGSSDGKRAGQGVDVGGRSRGGSFASNPGTDAASADKALLQQFGGALPKLATNEVLQALSRTTEMGLKDVGTTVEQGLKTGLDPLGDTATKILTQAENPKAPPVMAEIQGHLAGLEEIQAQYLANGDVALANKVQRNIDTLHALIGTVDENRAVTQRMASDAASSDAAMLNTARTQADRTRDVSSKQSSMLQKQSEALAAVRGQSGYLSTIAGKNFSPRITVPVTVNSFVTVQEWQRKVVSSTRALSNSGGFI